MVPTNCFLGIKLIKDLADAIDELTYVVVERAEKVSRNPADRKAKEELNALRRKWASKVQELTRVIDDIIDPEDFMAQSGIYSCQFKYLGLVYLTICFCVVVAQRPISTKTWRSARPPCRAGSGRSSADSCWPLQLRLGVRRKWGRQQ